MDKISLTLTCQVQARLRKEELIPVVMSKLFFFVSHGIFVLLIFFFWKEQFGNRDRHEKFMENVATRSITTSCLKFRADDFYLSRSTVDATMFADIQNEMNNHSFAADVEFFQLVHITLPKDLVDVITEKQNIQQNISTAQSQRNNDIIQAGTLKLQAEQQALIILIEANNTASIVNNKAQVQEEIILTKWDNLAQGYAAAVNSLSLNPSEFQQYLDAELLRKVSQAVV